MVSVEASIDSKVAYPYRYAPALARPLTDTLGATNPLLESASSDSCVEAKCWPLAVHLTLGALLYEEAAIWTRSLWSSAEE